MAEQGLQDRLGPKAHLWEGGETRARAEPGEALRSPRYRPESLPDEGQQMASGNLALATLSPRLEVARPPSTLLEGWPSW